MTERIATAYKLASFPGTWERGYDPITSTSASVDRLSARCCLNAQCRDGVTGKKKTTTWPTCRRCPNLAFYLSQFSYTYI